MPFQGPPKWPALLVIVIVILGAAWILTAPPDYLSIAPPYRMGDAPQSILQVMAEGDPIGDQMQTIARAVHGYDDLVLQEHLHRAFATGRDGWIWQIDLETGDAERLLDVPLMAAGAHEVPGDDDRICFCASHLSGATYPESERVGLYELTVSTKSVRLLVDRVPMPPPIEKPPPGNQGTVFTEATETRLRLDAMNDTNSRALAFCNDLAITEDGKRIYFSEPFPYEGASMGAGAFGEAITLGKNGRLWRYDRDDEAVALVAQDYNFIDGVLAEDFDRSQEESVLVTETTKFRILRLYIRGEKAGQDEIVWENLPSMADGMERDDAGRIWIGMIKKRSGLITWIHAHPFIKPFILRLPQSLLPVPTVTATMALSADASTPLYYAEHPGTAVHDIAAAIPGSQYLYLANFSDETPGLHRIPLPLKD